MLASVHAPCVLLVSAQEGRTWQNDSFRYAMPRYTLQLCLGVDFTLTVGSAHYHLNERCVLPFLHSYCPAGSMYSSGKKVIWDGRWL